MYEYKGSGEAYMSIEALEEVVQGIVCAKLDGLVQEEQHW